MSLTLDRHFAPMTPTCSIIDPVGGVDSAGFDIGGIYDVDERHHFLFFAGRGFEHASATNLLSWYVGWQPAY